MQLEFDGILWLILLTGPLLILQRKVHFEIQAVLLLLTRRRDVVLVIFSLIFLPGVLIHELSHFLTARLLGVRTGKFSLIPRHMGDGRLQLGSVETESADIFRDSIIGIAPLVIGGISITYIARSHLGFDQIITIVSGANLSSFLRSIEYIGNRPDFWLWFYLLFTISSTMLPSESDRRAWVPILMVFTLILVASLLVGIGAWILTNVTPAVNIVFKSLAFVFAISSLTHFILLLPVSFLRVGLSKIFKLNVR